MEELETLCMELITAVGTARSCYIEAIHYAKDGQYEEAKKSMEEGQRCFVEGHDVHLKMLAMQAEDRLNFNLLILHAEDQMMSAETFGILAEEFLDLYQIIKKED